MQICLSQNSYQKNYKEKPLIVTKSSKSKAYEKELPDNLALIEIFNNLIPSDMHNTIIDINEQIDHLIKIRTATVVQFRKDFYKIIDNHINTNPEYYI